MQMQPQQQQPAGFPGAGIPFSGGASPTTAQMQQQQQMRQHMQQQQMQQMQRGGQQGFQQQPGQMLSPSPHGMYTQQINATTSWLSSFSFSLPYNVDVVSPMHSLNPALLCGRAGGLGAGFQGGGLFDRH
jgi:hypothetical protein